MRSVQLLASRFFSHLPLDLGHAASRAPATHKANGRVAKLELVGNVQDLYLGIELARLTQGGVLLVDHDISTVRHVGLVQPLDVQANIVPWVGNLNSVVVHLHREDLATTRIRRRVRGQKHDLLPRLHNALLHPARDHVAHTLDLVDAGNRHTHGCLNGPLRHSAKLVQGLIEGLHVDDLLATEDVLANPPRHVLRLLQEVVTYPP
mmetsp:Transcript_96737/g.235170  ORF Transcript_96737/g.235170 Transcript_96737/m.235170 type:complete len:206 (-) Transcript_96737:267-884(-)